MCCSTASSGDAEVRLMTGSLILTSHRCSRWMGTHFLSPWSPIHSERPPVLSDYITVLKTSLNSRSRVSQCNHSDKEWADRWRWTKARSKRAVGAFIPHRSIYTNFWQPLVPVGFAEFNLYLISNIYHHPTHTVSMHTPVLSQIQRDRQKDRQTNKQMQKDSKTKRQID